MKRGNMKRVVLNSIWIAFLKTEAHDFAKTMGYGTDLIKNKIGIRKFILANGWTRVEHVNRWRTDAWKVIVCPACGNDFGIMNDDMGLCPTCLPKFDLNAYFGEVQRIVGEDHEALGAATGKAIIAFMCSPELREQYRKA